MKDFSDLHPLLSVDLGLNDRLVDLAEEGWDMAVRIGRLASSPLIAKKLATCKMALCASPEYLARHGIPKFVAELSDHECLGYTLSNVVGPHTWTFGTKTTVNVSVSGRLRSSNGDVLMSAAIAGQGLTYQPTFIIADAVRDGKLVPIHLEHPPFVIGDVFAIHLPTKKVSAKISAFTDFLASRFGGIPPWDRRFGHATFGND
jgi:DNA-binding transcriptional LysR family regulator